MRACVHQRRTDSQYPGFEICQDCGTYYNRLAVRPDDIYLDDYWSAKWDHPSIKEQDYNCDKHKEHGVTKNEFVINHIWTQDRSAVLEVGCAPGSLLRHLKDTCGFERVLGIEVNPKYHDEIRDIADCECEIIFGFFPEVTCSINDSSFSLVVALDVFEHHLYPELFLSECSRLLKPDGQLLVMAPLVSTDLDKRFFHSAEHVYIHSEPNMMAMLSDAGFTGIKKSAWTIGHETITARKV